MVEDKFLLISLARSIPLLVITVVVSWESDSRSQSSRWLSSAKCRVLSTRSMRHSTVEHDPARSRQVSKYYPAQRPNSIKSVTHEVYSCASGTVDYCSTAVPEYLYGLVHRSIPTVVMVLIERASNQSRARDCTVFPVVIIMSSKSLDQSPNSRLQT